MSEGQAKPHVRPHRDPPGVEIVDPIESARFALYTPGPVTPAEADPESFYFPVDAAVAIRTPTVEVPKLGNVLVRTQGGDLVADNAARDDATLPAGAYALELSTAPMKLYLAVESGLDLRHGDSSVLVDFGEEATVRVGARSFHERPAGTVTTPPDVESQMRAVSLLGSSLKTTSCERSFPTLRGYPPLIEVGSSFEVPPGLARPDTDVRVVCPPERSKLYPVAPLAFYLGAEVVPGDPPRLAADWFEHPLTGPEGFEATVHRTLQQVFFMDCLTRTEGYYRVDLHERRAVESHPDVDLDFADLYGRPLPAQLAAYLDVPFGAIADHVPDWKLTADVKPRADNVEVLPFLVDDLALVRCPGGTAETSVQPQPDVLADFYRDGIADFARSTRDGPTMRAGTGVEREDRPEQIFQPPPAHTVEHAWVGDGYPIGANKLTVEALRRGVEWAPSEDSRIAVRVVCNDPRMVEEGRVTEFYGFRDLLEFDVTIDHGLSTAELRGLLAEEADLLHYIGHVDRQGFECADGFLDARTLDGVGVRAFLLNACTSYEQGAALVEKGSLGGVVTLADVANSIATNLGRPLARLLNCGFPLRVALAIAQRQVVTGSRYVTVGDGGVTLCQSESGCPLHARVERLGPDDYEVEVRSYPTRRRGLGSMQLLHIDDSATRYLSSGSLDAFRVSGETLAAFLDLEVLPVEFEGELYWSDGLAVDDL